MIRRKKPDALARRIPAARRRGARLSRSHVARATGTHMEGVHK
jgi:hypothetical protein